MQCTPKVGHNLRVHFFMIIYTVEQKLEVLKYYNNDGLTETILVYDISASSIYKWLRKYERGSMSMKKNTKYTAEMKLEIIDYYRKNGYSKTENKYDISSSVFLKWESVLQEQGVVALGEEAPWPKNTNINDALENEDLIQELHRLRLEKAYFKKVGSLEGQKKIVLVEAIIDLQARG